MRVHLKVLGCRLNEAELESWANDFQKQGHDIVRRPEQADLMVVNTCAVTQEAVRKSRQTVRRLHRDNPAARLVVSGCYATLSPEEAAGTLGADMVVGNRDKARLVDLVTRQLDLPSMPAMATEPGAASLFKRGRERAFVKIQDGCRYRCTFCIVTVARGEERSRSVTDIVAEINTLHQQGIQEAVLTGVHVGGYGSDLGSSLGELVQAILADTRIPRLRFASVEPWDLPLDFFQLFADSRLMPHMHLPLQSGSDTVLRRMARRCKRAEFRALVEQARQAIPDFNVTTDIIVGFPGETDQEWRESLDFIESIGFGHLHIFPYSPRADTKAARLPEPVADSVKKIRSRELHALGARMKRRMLASICKRRFPVLWEGGKPQSDDGQRQFLGYTPNFLRVTLTTDENLSGQIREARVTDMAENGDTLLATLI